MSRIFCRNGHTGSYTLVTPKGKLHFAELRSLILVDGMTGRHLLRRLVVPALVPKTAFCITDEGRREKCRRKWKTGL